MTIRQQAMNRTTFPSPKQHLMKEAFFSKQPSQDKILLKEQSTEKYTYQAPEDENSYKFKSRLPQDFVPEKKQVSKQKYALKRFEHLK